MDEQSLSTKYFGLQAVGRVLFNETLRHMMGAYLKDCKTTEIDINVDYKPYFFSWEYNFFISLESNLFQNHLYQIGQMFVSALTMLATLCVC